MIANFGTLFAKELRDATRDRRSLFAGFVYALVGPLALGFVVFMMARQAGDAGLEPFKFCNAEMPAIAQALAERGLRRADDAKICLDVASDWRERAAAGKPVRMAIVGDMSRSADTMRRLDRELRRYAATLAGQRLIARGLAPAVAEPFAVETRNTGGVSLQAQVLTSMLIIFFVCAPFFASMSLAIDSTAGERERRSIESLLAQPVDRRTIVMAKWAMAATLGLLGTAVAVAGGLAVLAFAPLADLGVRVVADFHAAWRTIVLLTPLTLAVAAVQILIGLSARNYKEGQTYMTLLSFAPVLAGVMAIRANAEPKNIPVLWEIAALREPLLDAAAPSVGSVQAAAMCLTIVIVCLWFAARRLGHERILADG